MRYYGESNVPGAPGNFRTLEYVPARDGIPSFEPMPYYGGGMGAEPLAGGNFVGGEGLQINPEAHKTLKRQQKIYNKGIRTDNPNEREIFLQRTGPQLPLAQAYPGGQPLGNEAGLVAQAPSWQQILDRGTRESWTDIPFGGRMRTDAENLVNYQRGWEDKQNPLRTLPDPRMENMLSPGIVPYFRQHGPVLPGLGAI